MSNCGYTIKMNWDMVDEIVQQQLIDTYHNFKEDLGAGNSVFVWGDQEADDVEIQKRIDAFEIVLKWYCTPEQLTVLGLKDD